MAIGTQTNGSVIRPAAFCGVVGYKPGKGVLSTDGILPFSSSVDQPGVFARNVEDAALLVATWRIRAGPSARRSVRSSMRRGWWPCARRCGTWPSLISAAVSPPTSRCCARRLPSWMRSSCPPSFNEAHKVHRIIMLHEAGRGLAPGARPLSRQDQRFLNKALDEGDRISTAEYERALRKREALQRDFSRFLDDYDAVVTPPAARRSAALARDHRGSQLLHHLDPARRAGDHHSHRARQPRHAARVADRRQPG